jgi:hypothetical protein
MDRAVSTQKQVFHLQVNFLSNSKIETPAEKEVLQTYDNKSNKLKHFPGIAEIPADYERHTVLEKRTFAQP